MNLMKLKRRRHELQTEMRNIVQAAEKRENKSLTQEERGKWDKLNAELTQVISDLEVAERQKEIDDELERNAGPGTPAGNPPAGMTEQTPRPKGPSYRSLFPGEAVSFDGFKDAHEYLQAVRSNRSDDRLQTRAQSTTIPTEGGFAVPTAMSELLFDGALESEVIRPGADVFPMTSKELKVPLFDGEDRQSSIFGFSPSWVVEGGAGSVETAQLRQLALVAKKLMLFGEISTEAREDVRSFDEKLMTAMSQAVAWNLDDAFLNGTGAGQPLGILNAAATVTVAKRTGQAADTINHENLVDMQAKLLPGTLNGAVWLASETCMPELMTLAMVVGTGGIAVPMLQRTGDGWSLNGIPLYFTEKLPTLGNAGDLVLASRRHYMVGMRREISLKRSEGIAFMRDSEVYRAVVRVDGQPAFSKPITLANGNTVSPFVMLGERA